MFKSNFAVPLLRQKFFGRKGAGVCMGRPLVLRAMADADPAPWFRDADKAQGLRALACLRDPAKRMSAMNAMATDGARWQRNARPRSGLGLYRGLHADLAFNDAAFFRQQIGRGHLAFEHARAVDHNAALGGDVAGKMPGKQQFAHIKGALHLGFLAHVERALADDFAAIAAFNAHGALEVQFAFIDGIRAQIGDFVLCHVFPLGVAVSF